MKTFVLLFLLFITSVCQAEYIGGYVTQPSELNDNGSRLYYNSSDDRWETNKNIKGCAQGSTIVIAAYNSTNKEQADYVCDGTADNVEFQAAIDLGGRKKIEVRGGDFSFDAVVNSNQEAITIVGEGTNATKIMTSSGANCDIFNIEGTGSKYFNTIKDMTLDCNRNNNTSGSAIVGNELDIHLESLFIRNCSDYGVEINAPWGCVIRDVVIEYCDNDGLHIDSVGSTEIKVAFCKIMENVGSAIYTNGIYGKFVGNYLSTETPGEYIVDIESNSNNFTGNVLTSTGEAEIACIGVHFNGANNSFMGNRIEGVSMTKAYVFEDGKIGNECIDLIKLPINDWYTDNNASGSNFIMCRELLNNSGKMLFTGAPGYKFERVTGTAGALDTFNICSRMTSAMGFNDGPYFSMNVEDNDGTDYPFVRFTARSYGSTYGNFLMQVHEDASTRHDFLEAYYSSSLDMAVTDISDARLVYKSVVCEPTEVDCDTYSVLVTDSILNVNYTATGSVAITLPTAQTTQGRIITIVDSGNNANTNNITVTTQGAETIEGADEVALRLDGCSFTIYCNDGTNWQILSSYCGEKYRIFPLFAGSVSPGASGATFVPPDGNTLGGYQLNTATEYLYSGSRILEDWDGESDIILDYGFDINVAGADAGDTVDLKLIAYAKGVGESVTKTQTIEIATTIGTAAQYTQFVVEYTLDYDDISNPIDYLDGLIYRINLETDTSEVDDITIIGQTLKYRLR